MNGLLPAGSALFLGVLPTGLERVEIEARQPLAFPAYRLFHMSESLLEFAVRKREGILGVNFEVPGKIDYSKQEVTQLFLDVLLPAAALSS